MPLTPAPGTDLTPLPAHWWARMPWPAQARRRRAVRAAVRASQDAHHARYHGHGACCCHRYNPDLGPRR